MDISIVIPTYNGKHLLEQSILTVLESDFDPSRYEIIIVDNASSDGTKEYVDTLQNVHYIHLDQNEGFTKAVNVGISESHGTYILILNNDCFVQQGTIDTLYTYLETNTDYVATQPVILKPDRNVESIGYVVDLKKGKATVITDKTKRFSQYLEPEMIFKNGNVFGLSATCLLIRKHIIEDIGLFDESFHSYLEDVDLFIRLARKGYLYVPCWDASVIHQHRATSVKMGAYKQKHDLVNWIRIIFKNYPITFIIKYAPFLTLERLRNLSGLLKKIGTIYLRS